MSPWTAFVNGTARVWLHKRVVGWLYLINVLFAAIMVWPLRKLVGEISTTDLADDFVTGFSLDAFVDLWARYSPPIKSMGYTAVGLGVVYLIVNIFLTGGIVASLASTHRVSLRHFFHHAGRYFTRYLRLFLLLAVGLGLMAAAYHQYLQPKLKSFQEAAVTDVDPILWRGLVGVGLLVLGSLIIMVFDYAKIRTVMERRRSMVVATCVALGFSIRRCIRTISLFYLNLAIVGLLLVVSLLVVRLFAGTTTLSLVSLIVIQQLIIVARVWMKLSFFSTQIVLFQAVTQPRTTPPNETTPSSPT